MVGIALAFPFLLMLLMVVMERIEVPLRRNEIGVQLEAFLDSARAEEVETYVSEGFGPALDRYWRRRRHLDPTGPLPASPTPYRPGNDLRVAFEPRHGDHQFAE